MVALALGSAWPGDARADDEAAVVRRWASPQPTGESLSALWGSDAGVWAVGDAGTILRSTDHGATWAAGDSGTTQNLKAIWGAPDEGDLWIAGEGDTVLRSTNGGAAWHAVSTNTTGSLQGIWGSGPHDVYFVGDNGLVLHTDDHGRSFTTLHPLGDTDEQLTAVWGSAADDLYVTGDRGSVLTTSDHGQRWVTLRRPATRLAAPSAPGATIDNAALSIIGTARGDLVGSFSGGTQTRKGRAGGFAAEHSQDGGKTWKEIRVEPTPSPWPDFHAFHAGDGRTVHAVATFELWDRPVEDRQRLGLIVSRDGGATFERRSLLPSGATVNALWRDPTGPLIAVGPLGTILRSRDDGRTWEEGRAAHPFGTATLRALWTDGASEVWAVGDDCTILHSSDAGARFELMRPCPAGTGTELRSVWGGDADAAVYVGGAVVSRTVDRGQHWAVVTPPAPVAAFWRIWGSGAGDLYAAGYGVWRSTDDAQSWRLVDGSRSRNRNDWFGHLFGAGTDRFAVTQVGRLERGSKTGASWQPVAPPSAAPGAGCCAYWADGPAALYAFGPNHAFFRSQDAGRSFQPVATPLSNRTTFIALYRQRAKGGALFVLAQDPNPPNPSATTLLRSLDDGASFTTYALLPEGCTTLATVERGLLVVGTNGLIVSLRVGPRE
jgi:photosystem II stability/assembly factor-like uncharacterized protein